MGNQFDPESVQDQWSDIMEQMSDQFAGTMEASARAQSEFVETWFETVESLADEGYVSEGMEGYAAAYSVWMDAAEEAMEEVTAAASGEDVSPREFQDLWLDAANEAFKEVMSTDAYSALTGRAVEDALELRQATDEATQKTLHEFGFATEGDVREVGERLVELERREQKLERHQKEVERKLDRVLDHLEGEE